MWQIIDTKRLCIYDLPHQSKPHPCSLEATVQNDPPVQRDNVAEPLVRQLMGNQVENPEPEGGTVH